MENSECRPPIVVWTTLDLYRVDEAVERLRRGDTAFVAFEHFRREFRRGRSDWEFFAFPEPGDAYAAAARWMLAQAGWALEAARRAAAVGEADVAPDQWEQVIDGIERHCSILKEALEADAIAA